MNQHWKCLVYDAVILCWCPTRLVSLMGVYEQCWWWVREDWSLLPERTFVESGLNFLHWVQSRWVYESLQSLSTHMPGHVVMIWRGIALWEHLSMKSFIAEWLIRVCLLLWERWMSKIQSIQTWLILPVVICLSQRLSHACLSMSFYTVKLRMAH